MRSRLNRTHQDRSYFLRKLTQISISFEILAAIAFIRSRHAKNGSWHIDLFPRNLGDPSKRSSSRKKHGGWPSGLDLNERVKERSLIPDEEGMIGGVRARARRWMPKTQVVSMNSAMWGVGRGLLLSYTHYIGVLSFPWDRD